MSSLIMAMSPASLSHLTTRMPTNNKVTSSRTGRSGFNLGKSPQLNSIRTFCFLSISNFIFAQSERTTNPCIRRRRCILASLQQACCSPASQPSPLQLVTMGAETCAPTDKFPIVCAIQNADWSWLYSLNPTFSRSTEIGPT